MRSSIIFIPKRQRKGGCFLSKKDHIIIPHTCFYDEYTNSKLQEEFLSIDEMYLYSWLYRRRIPYNWNVETTIDTIHAFCITFTKGNDSRNKNYIKDLLINLKNKKYIKVYSNKELDEKIRYNDPIYISFPKIEKGYNANITYETFDKFHSPLEFYIYAYIDQFGDSGRKISYNSWSKILKKSDKTVRNVIQKMNSYQYHSRIWKFTGEYYESEEGVKQKENTYYTRPSKKIIKKWDDYYLQYPVKDNENVSEDVF